MERAEGWLPKAGKSSGVMGRQGGGGWFNGKKNRMCK